MVQKYANCCILASYCGAGHYFGFLIHRHLVLNLFLFLLSNEKLLDEFCYNRGSAAIRFCAPPILWCSLYCANTIGAAIFTLRMGKVQRTKKIRENSLLTQQICPMSPKGVASAMCFTCKGRVKCSANNVSCVFLYTTSLIPLHVFFQNSSINWAVLTGNGKMAKPRRT